MPEQTVFRAGNSNVVAIPKAVGDKYGIKTGAKVTIEEVPEAGGVLIKRASKPSKKRLSSGITPEFKKWLKEALKEDAEILDELADR